MKQKPKTSGLEKELDKCTRSQADSRIHDINLNLYNRIIEYLSQNPDQILVSVVNHCGMRSEARHRFYSEEDARAMPDRLEGRGFVDKYALTDILRIRKMVVLKNALKDRVLDANLEPKAVPKILECLRENGCTYVSAWEFGPPVLRYECRLHKDTMGIELQRLLREGFVGGPPKLIYVWNIQEIRNIIKHPINMPAPLERQQIQNKVY